MKREQIAFLDALPDGAPMSAEIRGRDGVTVASISAGIILRRNPELGRSGTWAVGFADDERRTALLTIRQCDRVSIADGRITIRR